MLKTNLSFLFCFLTVILFAQKNFEKGFVINLEGDTINGLILNKDKKINPRDITLNFDNKQTTFYAADIRGFGLKNEVFKSYLIEYDTSKYKTNEVTIYKDPKWKKDYVFLQLIVKGKLDLYQLIDESGKKHFFIKSENEAAPKELLLIKYLKGNDIAVVSRYRKTLRIYMDGSPQYYETIQKLDYKVKDLKNLFVNYNQDQNQFIYKYDPEKIKLKVIVSAGVSSAKLSASDNYDYPVSNQVSGGMALDIIFPKNRRKWSLLNELGFRSYKTSYNELQGIIGIGHEVIKEYDFTYLRLMSAIKYSINGYSESNKFTPFIYAGIVNSFVLFNNSSITTTYYPSLNRPPKIEIIDNIRKHEQAFVVGFGVDYKCKFGLDFRYERSNGFSAYPGYNTTVQTLFLLFRFTF